MSDNVIPLNIQDQGLELERSYPVPLTEKEMMLIARNVSKMFRRKHNGNHEQSKENTFHLMLICDKFSKALSSDNFTLVKKERLPV